MLYLYFIRHGQTEWNVAGRIQGWQDSNLTKQGINHACRLAENLTKMEWTAIYSSPSKRALKTAEIIKGNSPLAINQDKRLLEMNLGDWEGKTMEEIKEMNAQQHDYYWNNPSQYKINTGECFNDVKSRLEIFLEDIHANYNSGNILIVTHGVVIKLLQLISKQLEMDQLWKTPYIEGTSVTKVKIIDKKIELLLEGDISHIG